MSRSFLPDSQGSETAPDGRMEAEHLLLLEGKRDDLLVISRDGNRVRTAFDHDVFGTGRQVERISECDEALIDMLVGLSRSESSFLTHRVLVFVVLEIRLACGEREVKYGRSDHQRQHTAHPAHPGAVHHCDCAPSTRSLTILSIACFLPPASPRSSYCPSA